MNIKYNKHIKKNAYKIKETKNTRIEKNKTNT